MNLSVINTPQLSAYYDGIIHVTYRGAVDSHITNQVYKWRKDIFRTIPTNFIRGEIFDFRDVNDFMPGHLQAVQKASKELSLLVDLSSVPCALVVSSAYQMQTLSIAVQLTPIIERKHIVWSREEAFNYLQSWNESQSQAKIS